MFWVLMMPEPTQEMKDEAQRGLDWRSEFGRGGTEIGIARARDIVNGRNLSDDTVRRMKAYFDRHEIDKEAEGFRPGEDGYPSNGRIAWALWGGDAGRSWANALMDNKRDRVVCSFQISEFDMQKRAEPDALRIGDYVTWDSSGGEAYGRIQRIERDGKINVPNTDFSITGTEEDPAALIMLFREGEEGWDASGTLVGHKFSTLTKVTERDYHDGKKKKRHIKRIQETDEEIIITFGKARDEADVDDDTYIDVGISETAQREVRPTQKIEVRAEENGGIRVTGYAAIFGEEANIGGMFTEVIEKGAFRSALDRNDDVVFLINHGGLPLARTRSGTLKLKEDDRGLFVDTYLDASDPDVRSIVSKMKRGDLDKMSFAFVPTRQSWDDSGAMPKRSIQDLQLFDVSIVTTPAYEGTEIGLRSLQMHRDKQIKNQAARRLRMKAQMHK